MGALARRLREPLGAFARAARNRGLRRLQLGWAGAAIGHWAAALAITVLSYEKAGAGAVGVQVVIRMLPSAVAAPFMSTFADRYPRVRVMVVADVTRVGVLLAMAALVAADAPLLLVYVGSAIAGLLSTAFEPAKSAVIPGLARDPEELTAANVVSSSIDSLSFFAGPAIGGVLLAASSPQVVLLATAATFAWSAALISGIREPARAGEDAADDEPAEPFLVAAAAGARTVVRVPEVRVVVGLLGLQTFVDGLSIALVTALALDVLEIGEAGVGWLNAAVGVGGLVGATAAVTLVGERRLARAFAAGCLLFGAPFALIGVAPEVAVAAVALAVVGLGNTWIDVSGYTLLQRTAPEEVLGRVFGVLEMIALLTIGLGALASPLLIDAFGTKGALVAAGALLPTGVVLATGVLRRMDAASAPRAPLAELALLRGVPIFEPLPAPLLERLAGALRTVAVPAGALVFQQGDAGEDFYVIEDGSVDVLIDGRMVNRLGPGHAFGEIALLRDVPRTATVRAHDDARLRALGRDDFLTAVGAHPASAAEAETLARTRLAWARPAPSPA